MTLNPSSRRAQHGSTLAGLLVGLLVGVVIAAGVALYINFGPKPFVEKPAAQPARPAADSAPAAATAATASTPAVLPGKPGEAPMEKPKYDFYKILPGGESAPAPVAGKPEAVPERIYLQAGAYQSPSDADNLKARLALMGFDASVQRVDLGEKGIFYRVRLGSFATPEAAESMRARLATEGIEAAAVRAKP